MKHLLLALLTLSINLSLIAQSLDEIPTSIYDTKKITGKSPTIDGLLDDESWKSVAWSGEYTQHQPEFGIAPLQQTSFKVLYDDENLYLAYRCFDTEPDKIVKRMSRRDGFDGDWVEINIDSYFDKRTAFSFTISASGVRGDEFVSNDGQNWDTSWNPIWFSKTNVDDKGWTAEMRIPLSQLRYADKEEQVWGLQSTRRIFRNEERSTWQPIPQNAGVWVSAFGELRGLKGLKTQKQIEIQPYVVAQLENSEAIEGNPYATGSDTRLSGGVDGKIGITSDLVLDFTINPDFGQVEADPSVVALDGFQVFFSERRPFFIENRNIFDYSIAERNNNNTLFYSRRIGGNPNGHPSLEDGEYADVPSNTSILGAAKFSGKTTKGLSIGLLESVTAKEYATIDNNGEEREELIEPLTSYAVTRLQQDFNEGNTYVGGMLTATNRALEGTGLDFLHKSAYSGGLDFRHRWGTAQWVVSGRTLFSQVNGSETAILNTQKSLTHNFQRPDASHLSVDENARSLAGNAGALRVAKTGGNLNYDVDFNWRTPGFETNDVGFLRNADEINTSGGIRYSIVKPFSAFRTMAFGARTSARWDFGGQHLYQNASLEHYMEFKNYWTVFTSIFSELRDLSNYALRGGPTLRLDRALGWSGFFSSNQRKKIFFGANWTLGNAEREAVKFRIIGLNATIQPTNALNISLSPNLVHIRRQLQYVDILDFQDKETYLMGSLDQHTLSMTARLNYNITPDLTIQYYGQPFISRGRYSTFKHIVNPLEKRIEDRFELLNTEFFDGGYAIDHTGDGITDYSIGDPDFNFIQFRSNLVARWEYVPGSELYLVWSQGTTAFGNPADDLLPSLGDNLFSEKATNIFLLKWTYRFLL